MASPSEVLPNTDAVAVARAWLSQHARVTAALGGVGRVDAVNRPPYPRIRLRTGGGGSERLGRWDRVVEVVLEALGDLDGSTSPTALNQVVLVAVGALVELPAAPYVPGTPVVTFVQPSLPCQQVDLPTGQGRWQASVLITIHPPA